MADCEKSAVQARKSNEFMTMLDRNRHRLFEQEMFARAENIGANLKVQVGRKHDINNFNVGLGEQFAIIRDDFRIWMLAASLVLAGGRTHGDGGQFSVRTRGNGTSMVADRKSTRLNS